MLSALTVPESHAANQSISGNARDHPGPDIPRAGLPQTSTLGIAV